ncbi:MAG TPA: FAD-dependent oxidoreductase [Rubrobacter sp.]|nr:FAD-dependent oxidoreductase [Rubrobacter sp.]
MVVVGCGVIGLTAAICLRESGLDARIVTAELPPETTSSVAAAIWYPYKAYPEDRVLSWGSRTFEVFEELSTFSSSGVLMREGVEIWHEKVPDPWWASAVPGVRRCREEELPPGYRDGHAFVAPVVEMPIYLQYLMDRFSAAGGSVEVHTLSSLDDVDASVVVNCAGLGARDLVDDASMEPIRGQIVRVRNPGIGRFVLDEENPDGVTYIVPRSADCILGGTAEEGEWNIEPDPETAAGILRRCTDLEPRLIGAEVLEHKVGLRPGRPEIRLEHEDGGIPRIHNYGHGGSGITLSWGCAEETLRLVEETLGA